MNETFILIQLFYLQELINNVLGGYSSNISTFLNIVLYIYIYLKHVCIGYNLKAYHIDGFR
jgi:hypothetical protein